MRVLVTGAAGFVGRHLCALAARLGAEVFGTHRPSSRERGIPGARMIALDLMDGAAVRRALEDVRPDRIFHLAGQAFVPSAWENPSETLVSNVLPAVRLLESARDLRASCRVIVAGSAEEYGPAAGGVPLDEDSPLKPENPYGASKAAQGWIALQLAKRWGLHVTCIRGFSQIGPGQDERFAASAFARQIALIEAGRQEPRVAVGNLEALRDFTDVRDSARAYWIAGDSGEAGGVYNVCSGRPRRVREVLEGLRAHSKAPFEVKEDASRLRAVELEATIGSPARMAALGWTPEFTFEQSLKDLLDDWRNRVASGDAAGKNRF